MNKDEALKMAVEQLWSCSMLMNLDHSDYLYEDVIKAHDACKEALAQPAQYSDIISDGGGDPRNKLAKPIQDAIDFLDGSYEAHKIRKALQEALEQPAQEFFERGKEIAKWADKQNEQPAQEPVAWATEWEDGEWSVSHSPNMGKQSIPLYTIKEKNHE
jgi:hypothetical protein